MEWSTLEERIQKDKIRYRFRLEYIEENRWPKKIFRWINDRGKFKRERNRINKIDMKIRRNLERN